MYTTSDRSTENGKNNVMFCKIKGRKQKKKIAEEKQG